MDSERFDDFIRAFAMSPSRRTILRSLGGGVSAALIGTLGYRQAAAACKKDGKKCDKDKDCCSGTCKGKKGKRKCRSEPLAFGCTTDDACNQRPCPDDPDGDCAVTITGKPFCFRDGQCFDCSSNQDCVDAGQAGGHCVKCPEECVAATNFRACVSREANEMK